MKIGQRIYIFNKYGKFIRKISHVGENLIEWKYGYGKLCDILPNNDNKSKVKYIINQLN
jgi:hypothetical protein